MARKLVPAFALALSAMAVAACNADDLITSDGGLAIEASISSASIGPTETATITYRLRNVGQLTRTVSVGCEIGRFRVDNEQGANVFPGNQTILCPMIAYPPEVLAPGEEVTRTFMVSGAGAAGVSSVKLPAGRYTATAEFGVGVFERRYIQLRTPEVEFEVR